MEGRSNFVARARDQVLDLMSRRRAFALAELSSYTINSQS
jgi:hypothetical protein